MEEKIQANPDDSNAVAHIEKQYEVFLSWTTSGDLIRLPSSPEDWEAPVPKVHKGETAFIEADIPGNWSQFTYQAKFDSKGQYKHHTIPTGAVPVPLKNPQHNAKVILDRFLHNKFLTMTNWIPYTITTFLHKS
jgi:hypothetical protein